MTTGLIGTLIIGFIIGAITGYFTKNSFGILGNIIVGLAGSFVGSMLFPATSTVGTIISGTIGAIILLFVINLFLGRRKY